MPPAINWAWYFLSALSSPITALRLDGPHGSGCSIFEKNENTKKGTQVYSNVSHIYGPDAPLLLTDPGDISFDPDGVTFPCDDSYDIFKPENYSENKYHGRLCDSQYEMCIGRQRCFPVDPDTGLYNKSFPENDDCYHNTTWPGWKGWFKNIAYLELVFARKPKFFESFQIEER